jgi:hypothetical protein
LSILAEDAVKTRSKGSADDASNWLPPCIAADRHADASAVGATQFSTPQAKSNLNFAEIPNPTLGIRVAGASLAFQANLRSSRQPHPLSDDDFLPD